MRAADFSRLRRGGFVGALLAALLAAGCASPPPKPPPKPKPAGAPSAGALSEKAKQEQRQSISKVRNGTLNQLYKLKPLARGEIEQAAGYGVFEINGLNAVLAGKHGRGVVVERSGKSTYMQLARTDIGPGATLRPYWQVLVFRDAQQLSQFVSDGSPADAANMANVTIYQLNELGVSSPSNWGARYFRDPNLN